MVTPIIVIARPLPETFVKALRALGEVRQFDAVNSLFGATVWVGTVLDQVSAELIDQFPDSLGLIANFGVGLDNIDLSAATARGIQVSNTPVVTEDTADLCMTLILATCRRLTVCERLLRCDNFAAGAAQLGLRVHGKTLGLVGFGEIGQAVARRASGFGMQILYTGPSRKPDAEQDTGANFVAKLDDLLTQADIVSLHCPLTSSSHHLLNRDRLTRMKTGSILINTGRGPLVDEAALVEALSSGQLGGAGLDVYEFEPQVSKELYQFDNVTLLPHIGSATGECRTDMAMRVIENIRTFLRDGVPQDSVNSSQIK